MLPALIFALAAIWRSVVAEKPWRRNNWAADRRMRSRDRSDFGVALSGAVLRLREVEEGFGRRLADRLRDRSPERWDDLAAFMLARISSRNY